MQRSDDDTWNQARSVGATATFGAESKSRLAEVGCRQHNTCPRW
jgi:hypothetical protein